MNNTGRLIQELRAKAGFTQKTLAEALHITDRAVSKWERGYSLPDIALLPKLSLLLDVDVEVLISQTIQQENWIGLIDIADCDFSQIVYDKPLIYYLFMHFLLLGVRHIHVMTEQKNREFLQNSIFQDMGLQLSFDLPEGHHAMIMNHPWFLFGSDLTQQFKGAMISGRDMKLVPEKQEAVFFFLQNVSDYLMDRKRSLQRLKPRTLGRGMICLDMSSYDNVLDAASFIRTYQNHSGLLIGSLEEIAYRKGIIIHQQLIKMAETVPYGDFLRNIIQPPVG